MTTNRNDCLELITCPVCGSNQSKPLFSITHNNSNVLELLEIECSDTVVEIMACQKCSHRYMSPVIKEDLMNRYYSVLNSEFYHSGKAVYNENKKEYEYYIQVLQKFKKTGSVLEIGCGNGFLLKMLEAEGYECCGVEPSPMAFTYAKDQLELNVENTFLTESSFYDRQFDIVILIDVAEHLVDMRSLMLQVKKILKDGGVIFIGTGNMDSLNARIAGKNWGYFLSWEHISFFTRASMRYLLEANHFTNIDIKETSLQHKPVQNTVEFFKNIAKKIFNPFFKKPYYHGITFDHFIVTATNKKGKFS